MDEHGTGYSGSDSIVYTEPQTAPARASEMSPLELLDSMKGQFRYHVEADSVADKQCACVLFGQYLGMLELRLLQMQAEASDEPHG